MCIFFDVQRTDNDNLVLGLCDYEKYMVSEVLLQKCFEKLMTSRFLRGRALTSIFDRNGVTCHPKLFRHFNSIFFSPNSEPSERVSQPSVCLLAHMFSSPLLA